MQLQDVSKPSKLYWIVLAFILLICVAFFSYADIWFTFNHSMHLLDSIFEGNPLSFYERGLADMSMDHPAVYDVPIYLIIGIFNLPIYLIRQFFHIDLFHSEFLFVWGKLLIAAFSFLLLREQDRIAHLLGLNKGLRQWSLLLTLSSFAFIFPAFAMSQYDIVSLVFMLWGIRLALSGKRWGFILVFSVAITLKSFAIFIFLPLLLLQQKNPFIFVRDSLVGLVPTLLSKLAYGKNVAYQASTASFNDLMIAKLFGSYLDGSNAAILPIFFIALFGIIIFCYTISKDDDRIPMLYIYVPAFVFGFFSISIDIHPHWFILIAPFFSLLLVMNRKHQSVSVLLDAAAGVSYYIIMAMSFTWIFSKNIFSHMALQSVYGAIDSKYSSISEFATAHNFSSSYLYIIAALFAAAIVGFLILQFPRKKPDQDLPVQPYFKTNLWIRMFAFAALILFTMAVPLIPKPHDQTPVLSRLGSVDELTPDVVETPAADYVSIDHDTLVTRVAIQMNQVDHILDTKKIIVLTISDEEGNELYRGEKPANTIKNYLLEFKIPRILMKNDQFYHFILSGRYNMGAPVQISLHSEENDGEIVTNWAMEIDGEMITPTQEGGAQP